MDKADIVFCILVRLCFVTTLERSLKIDSGKDIKHPPCVNYNVSGSDMVRVSGKIRETACEVLFRLDADEISLTLMLLNALAKVFFANIHHIRHFLLTNGTFFNFQCPIDTRRTLAENIFLIGGTSSLPGIKSRLLSELRYYVKSPKYKNKLFINNFKIHSSPSKENYTAWLGGNWHVFLQILDH